MSVRDRVDRRAYEQNRSGSISDAAKRIDERRGFEPEGAWSRARAEGAMPAARSSEATCRAQRGSEANRASTA